MRRKDRQVLDFEQIAQMLREAAIVRVAYSDAQGLTIVPMTFVPQIEDGVVTLLAHGADQGRKYAAFSAAPLVAFEAEAQVRPVVSECACANSWVYASVVGSARVRLVLDPVQKRQVLQRLLERHAPGVQLPDSASTEHVAVYAFDVVQISAKRRPSC